MAVSERDKRNVRMAAPTTAPMTAEQHIETAEALLDAIPVNEAERFDPSHAHAAMVAQAHATLAVAKLTNTQRPDG